MASKNGFVSEELQGNCEIVLTAVQQNGVALYHASDELKNDPGLLKIARQNG